MKYFAWICLTVMAVESVGQQKQTTHIQQAWFGYVNNARLSDHWGLWLDLQLRTKEDFVNDLSTAIIRPGISYYANDRLRFTVGYAYANFFPADDHSGVSQPEHRPWQQVYWSVPGKRSRVTNAIRIEERYRRKIKNADELGDGYNFNFRARYNTMLMLPLSRNAFAPNTLSVALNNELMVNFGKQIVNNYFDQNRLLLGFAYHVNQNDYLQFGYMNLFQQLSAGNRYKMLHVARVYFYHNIDLRSKKN
jgi:hypothetical protein